MTWLGKLEINYCMKPLTSFVMQYLWGIIQILLQSDCKMSFMPLNAVKLNTSVEIWWEFSWLSEKKTTLLWCAVLYNHRVSGQIYPVGVKGFMSFFSKSSWIKSAHTVIEDAFLVTENWATPISCDHKGLMALFLISLLPSPVHFRHSPTLCPDILPFPHVNAVFFFNSTCISLLIILVWLCMWRIIKNQPWSEVWLVEWGHMLNDILHSTFWLATLGEKLNLGPF